MKTLAKFALKLFPWETVVGWLFEIATRVITDWLNDKVMSVKAKYFTMGMYVLAEGIGDELAKDTRTTVDDDAVGELKTLCMNLTDMQGFTLPKVQEL